MTESAVGVHGRRGIGTPHMRAHGSTRVDAPAAAPAPRRQDR
ncbi:hypothetical protein ACFC09_42345 [Streptomyces sp. NPDC056161]